MEKKELEVEVSCLRDRVMAAEEFHISMGKLREEQSEILGNEKLKLQNAIDKLIEVKNNK